MSKAFWLIVGALILLAFLGGLAFTQAEWAGTDESVIVPVAEKVGVEAADPFFDPQGDLLLFMFMIGGAVGGFAAGYLWRVVFDKSRHQSGPALHYPGCERW